MSASLIAVLFLVLLLVAVVVLVLLWALTEELPRTRRVRFHERLEPGEWGVRVETVGRRKMKAVRVVNEVLGGDLVAARHIVEHPPAVVVDHISERLAVEIVEELSKSGVEAVAYKE